MLCKHAWYTQWPFGLSVSLVTLAHCLEIVKHTKLRMLASLPELSLPVPFDSTNENLTGHGRHKRKLTLANK